MAPCTIQCVCDNGRDFNASDVTFAGSNRQHKPVADLAFAPTGRVVGTEDTQCVGQVKARVFAELEQRDFNIYTCVLVERFAHLLIQILKMDPFRNTEAMEPSK